MFHLVSQIKKKISPESLEGFFSAEFFHARNGVKTFSGFFKGEFRSITFFMCFGWRDFFLFEKLSGKKTTFFLQIFLFMSETE